jgi:hypothetical protein
VSALFKILLIVEKKEENSLYFRSQREHCLLDICIPKYPKIRDTKTGVIFKDVWRFILQSLTNYLHGYSLYVKKTYILLVYFLYKETYVQTSRK